MRLLPSLDNPVSTCDTTSHYECAPIVSTSAPTRRTKTVVALHAAFLRLLNVWPLAEITVDAIAREAQVHRATFFRHFPSQRALLDDVAGAQIEQLSELTVTILREQDGCAATTALFTYAGEHRKIWTALLSGAEGAMRSRLNTYSMAMAARNFPESNDPLIGLRVRLSNSVVLDSLGWWLSGESDGVDQGELAAIVDDLLTNIHRIHLKPAFHQPDPPS